MKMLKATINMTKYGQSTMGIQVTKLLLHLFDLPTPAAVILTKVRCYDYHSLPPIRSLLINLKAAQFHKLIF